MPGAVLRTDGGARGNPGPAGAGFVLEDPNGALLSCGGKYLGETTNNVAEYEALIWGLQTALASGIRAIAVFCDSELVVKQVNGVYKVKHPNMRPLFVRALELLRKFDSCEVRHVLRAQNSAADALVNEAIDARGRVGDAACGATHDLRGRQDALFE